MIYPWCQSRPVLGPGQVLAPRDRRLSRLALPAAVTSYRP